jgi:hypothetical protein
VIGVIGDDCLVAIRIRLSIHASDIQKVDRSCKSLKRIKMSLEDYSYQRQTHLVIIKLIGFALFYLSVLREARWIILSGDHYPLKIIQG